MCTLIFISKYKKIYSNIYTLRYYYIFNGIKMILFNILKNCRRSILCILTTLL